MKSLNEVCITSKSLEGHAKIVFQLRNTANTPNIANTKKDFWTTSVVSISHEATTRVS